MNWAEAGLLFGSALLGGAMNSVAGGGSFFSFPALLFTGVPPVIANATNTIALWPGAVSSAFAYRRELRVHSERLPRLAAISMAGGLAGALLLLLTPDRVFEHMVPWLLLAATLLFAFGRRLTAFLHHMSHRSHRLRRMGPGAGILTQLAIAVYGGYFGAGIGILMLALLELMGLENIHEMNSLKSFLGSLINGVAVVTFIVAGAVLWPQALLMIVGAVIGGYGGASYARKMPKEHVRRFVLAVAVAMTLWFFYSTYLQ